MRGWKEFDIEMSLLFDEVEVMTKINLYQDNKINSLTVICKIKAATSG